MKDVKGKVVLITGAALGMGKGLAGLFAGDGARLVLWDLNAAEMEKTTAALKQSGAEVHPYLCDITNRTQVHERADQVRKEVGPVDVLVNNAGVVFGGEFLQVPEETIERTLQVNLVAYFWVTRAFLPDLVKKRAGHIVNLASAAGLMGVPDLTAYCASKFGVIGFSEALRLELRRAGLKDIKLTIVCPSYVATGMFEGVKPPLFSPFIPPEVMVRKIYQAVKKDKVWVLEPASVKAMPFLKAITAQPILDFFSDLLGVNRSMRNWKGRK
jgi:all-trans-retinol dehydrogenase (NAD+)